MKRLHKLLVICLLGGSASAGALSYTDRAIGHFPESLSQKWLSIGSENSVASKAQIEEVLNTLTSSADKELGGRSDVVSVLRYEQMIKHLKSAERLYHLRLYKQAQTELKRAESIMQLPQRDNLPGTIVYTAD